MNRVPLSYRSGGPDIILCSLRVLHVAPPSLQLAFALFNICTGRTEVPYLHTVKSAVIKRLGVINFLLQDQRHIQLHLPLNFFLT